MEDIVFVTDPKYCGMFVALKSLEDKEVVASGNNMSQVVFEAIVMYVPKKDEVFIF